MQSKISRRRVVEGALIDGLHMPLAGESASATAAELPPAGNAGAARGGCSDFPGRSMPQGGRVRAQKPGA